MDNLDKYKRLAESQRDKKAKLEGKVEGLYEELGEEGFTSLDSAKKDMILLGKKISKMRKIFTDKLELFEKRHAQDLQKTNR